MNTNTTNKCYPNILQGFGILLLFVMISMLAGFIVLAGNLTNNDQLYTPLTALAYFITAGGTLLIIIRQKTKASPGFPLFVNKRTFPITIIFSLLSALAVIILSEPLLSMLPVSDFYLEMITKLDHTGLSMFLMTVIFAPILEELIIRGIILEGFLRNYSPGLSIFLSSLIFGILHFNLVQFTGAFILGLFIGWVYYQTRNLILPILIHFLNNLLSYVLLYFTDANPIEVTLKDLVSSNSAYWFIMISSAVILIMNFTFYKKIMNPVVTKR